jgi:hypothetical protein
MMLVRDPWGVTKWNGAWNNEDKLWNDVQENERFSRSHAHSGAFYITYEEFLKGFNSVKICYCFDDHKYTALRVNNVSKNQLIAIQIEIPSKEEYFFSFCQINARCYKNIGHYEYSNIAMYLLREYQSGKIEYLKGVFKNFKEGWIKHKCVKGKYWILLNPHWKSFIKQFVFSVYGPRKCELQMVL